MLSGGVSASEPEQPARAAAASTSSEAPRRDPRQVNTVSHEEFSKGQREKTRDELDREKWAREHPLRIEGKPKVGSLYWVRLEEEDADGELKVGLVEVQNVGPTNASSAWFVRRPTKDTPRVWPKNPGFQHYKPGGQRSVDELEFEAFLMAVSYTHLTLPTNREV